MRAAFYYPWFPQTWGSGTHYNPVLGMYDSSIPAVIDQHYEWLQAAACDAIISSWWGSGDFTDARLGDLLDRSPGVQVAPYYELEGTENQRWRQIRRQLTYVKQNYAGHKNFLHINGKPVIFTYGGPDDDCGMADRWNRANEDRFYTVLKVFPGYATCLHQPSSWHQYAPANREQAVLTTDGSHYSTYSVSPGFWFADDATPRLARDPAAFERAVQNMVNADVDIELVTTFNEWGEGTAVEPAQQWGSDYIDILGRVK